MILTTFDINDFTKEEYNYWYNLLSAEKKQKVDRIKIENNKKSTVAGEMLARKMIATELNISPKEINFAISKKGKPYAENFDIHFNISHSHNMVVCVVDKNEIGVDIEKIRPIDLKIAKRICLENELKYIFDNKEPDYNSNSELILKRFFEIWTGKEAYFKYTGTGITDFSTVDTLSNPQISKAEYKDGYVIRIAGVLTI